MTTEQAISNLKEIIELSRNEINKKNENLTGVLDLTDLESLDVVLSMLENQKERIDYLMRSIERKEQSLIEEHEKNIECYTKIEEKNKIIDLMAEMLVKVPDNSDSPQTATIIAMINRDLELRKIKVKQYFEKKVKEEE